jgi:hypothetical protein
MNFTTKFIASFLLSKLPCSMLLYNATQKYLTGRWHRSVAGVLAEPNNYTMHIDTFQKHWGDLKHANYFEFGVARDLFSNLFNYCCGMEKQLAIDLKPLATRELVDNTRGQLCACFSPYITRKPELQLGRDFKADLMTHYGIDYQAPADARSVQRPSGSVDLIASTSTFEHIPQDAIREILAESYRLCHEGSIMSHEIDYSDHYSHTDKSLTPYNFLRFSDRNWERLHMRHYYQNRLRHNDIRQLIQDAGFTIIEEKTTVPDDAALLLSGLTVHEQFRSIPTSDLLATKGYFVAKK